MMFPCVVRGHVKALLVVLLLLGVLLPNAGVSGIDTRVTGLPQCYFRADPMIGYAPLEVELDATDDIPDEFYYWNLDWDGDGVIDDEGNDDPVAEVTYETPGRYYPTFIFLNNDYGEITRVTTEVIVNMPQDEYADDESGIGTPTLEATLIVEPEDGFAPLEVDWEAEGMDEDYYYYWEIDYDGDGVADAEDYSDPEGEYTYETAGTYYPTIVFYNNDYGVAATAQAMVTVEQDQEPDSGDIGTPGLSGPQTVTLYADPESGEAPLTVEFEIDGIDEENYSSWSLDFDGDGAADIDDYGEFEAEVTYQHEGRYYPAVVLFNDDGGIAAQGWCEVEAYAPTAWQLNTTDLPMIMPGQITDSPATGVLQPKLEPTLIATPDYGNPPLNVHFSTSDIDISDYAYWELDWDGDGNYDGGDKGAVIWMVTYGQAGRYFPTVWFYDSNHNLIAEAWTEVVIEEPIEFKLGDDNFGPPFDGDPEPLAEKWEPRVANVKTLTVTATPATGETPFEPEFTVQGVDFAYWLWELDWDSDGTVDRVSQTWSGKIKGYYSNPGDYTAKITFYNSGNQVIAEGETKVKVTGMPSETIDLVPANVNKLQITPNAGNAPLEVFVDARAFEPASWYAWGFDHGDGVVRYPETRPAFRTTYDQPGQYLAKITFYDSTFKQLAYGEAQVTVNAGSASNQAVPPMVVADLRVEYMPGDPGPWTVKWDASHSTPKGGIVMFNWDTHGSGSYDTKLSDKLTHISTYTRPGRHKVAVQVVDAYGNKDRAERTIDLGGIFADLKVYPTRGTAPFTFFCDGSGSHSANRIISYKWRVIDKGNPNDKDDGYYSYDTATPTRYHVLNKPGKYEVILAVDDGQHTGMKLAKATFPVEVVASGKAPVASIIASGRGGQLPYAVDFNASSSYDPDGSIHYYVWDADIGDENPPVTISQSIGEDYSYTYTTPGLHTAMLYVIDNEELASRIETVYIDTWNETTENLTARLTATPTSGQAPLRVHFDATQSTFNGGKITRYILRPDVTNLSYELARADGNFVFDYAKAGIYTAKLLVVVYKNGQPISAGDSVTIEVAPHPGDLVKPGGPIARASYITGGGANSLLVTFDASSSYVANVNGWQDPLHKVVKTYFDPNSRDSRAGIEINATTWSHTYGAPGTYYASVVVEDDLGRKSEPLELEIILKKPSP